MGDRRRWSRPYGAADDERLLNGDRSCFRYLAVRFDALLPMVACGAFHVEYDLEGTPLQRLGHGDAPFEVITLTVTLANISVMAR